MDTLRSSGFYVRLAEHILSLFAWASFGSAHLSSSCRTAGFRLNILPQERGSLPAAFFLFINSVTQSRKFLAASCRNRLSVPFRLHEAAVTFSTVREHFIMTADSLANIRCLSSAAISPLVCRHLEPFKAGGESAGFRKYSSFSSLFLLVESVAVLLMLIIYSSRIQRPVLFPLETGAVFLPLGI